MAKEERLKIWETLFQRALVLMDEARSSGIPVDEWTFGGGIFPEGEIDFVASAPLTEEPAVSEQLFGHDILVENSSEIVAKKVWYRGEQFTARDIFDLAAVAEKEPGILTKISPILQGRRDMVLARIEKHGARLRQDFQALQVLNCSRTFEQCVDIMRATLSR